MQNRGKTIGSLTLAIASLMFLQSCAVKVKTRENWNEDLDRPIPLQATAVTWRQIQSGQLPATEKLERYNEATRSAIVQVASNWASDKRTFSSIETIEGSVQLDVQSINVRDVEEIVEVIPSSFVKVKKGFRSTTEVKGVGASLLVRQERCERDPLIPEEGLWYPVTAVLNLDRPSRPILELFDPTRNGDLRTGNGSLPLATNYTTSFAREFQDRQNQILDVPGLLKFDKFADNLGLFRISAFDPEKTACVLVHGINSSPTTWDETLNELYADRMIRENYEFWTFGYPTGASIPYLAAKFRDEMAQMQSFRVANGAVDPDVTVIGHSMGGLLAKAITFSGGDAEWNKLFRVPIEELKVKPQAKKLLREMIYYEPLPYVDKVLFIATPHRGSTLADKLVFRIVGDIVQVPTQLAQATTEIIKETSYAFTPLGLEIAQESPTSIDQLRTNSRATAQFLDKPLNPSVEYYSIIGNNSRASVPLEKSSDSIVPYRSSHIEGVESEAIINGSKHGVHHEEAGIDEVIRILKLP